MSFPLSIIKREEFSSHPLLKRLLELHDIPEQLYISGTLPTVIIDEYGRATPRILSVVGSRKHTQYGKHAVEKLVSSLRGENVVILSGLAYGIDSIAHLSALENNIQTCAVLGNGISEAVMYPKNHTGLAQEIIDKGGALISEYPPDSGADHWHFPARNRIVAALGDAVLVGEADEKSGTLITARQALELGRDIGAIPGDIFSPTSRGTHALIRDGAYIISSEDDLAALLHLTKNNEKSNKTESQLFTNEEKIILELLIEPLEKDTLFLKSSMSFETFLVTISSLEIKGAIEETFGEVRRLV